MVQILLPVDLPAVHLYDSAASPLLTLPTAHDDTVEVLFDQLRSACNTASHTLVVMPSWLDVAVRARLRSVRRLLPSASLSLIEVDLPPLATAVLAHQLSVLSSVITEPSQLVSAVPVVAGDLTIGACMASVARFARAPVPFGTHVASFLPRTAFVAVLAPVAQVAEARRWRPATSGPRSVQLLHGDSDACTGWGRAAVALRLGATRVHPVPQASQAALWWGTRRVTEFVAASEDPQDLVRVALSQLAEPGNRGGTPVTGTSYPRCGPTVALKQATPRRRVLAARVVRGAV